MHAQSYQAGLIEHQLDALLTQGGGHVPDRPEHGHSGNMLAPAPFQNVISTGIEPSFDTLLATSQAPTAISVDSVIARTELDMLYHQYFKAVDPLAHLLHKPTFDRQFCRVMLGQHPSKTATKSFTALVLAMCFAAAVSLTNSQPQVHFQTNKAALVEKLKLATERALSAAQHMKSLKLVTMQAFTIYLVRSNCSTASSYPPDQLTRFLNAAERYRDPKPPSLEPWFDLPSAPVYTEMPPIQTQAPLNAMFEACCGIKSASLTCIPARHKDLSL